MKENAVSLSAPTHSPVKSAVKSHEQLGTAAPPTAPAPASDAQISSNIVAENGNNQDAEGIYAFWHSFLFFKSLACNLSVICFLNDYLFIYFCIACLCI